MSHQLIRTGDIVCVKLSDGRFISEAEVIHTPRGAGDFYQIRDQRGEVIVLGMFTTIRRFQS